MFDPTVGRWFEEDPEGFAAGDTNLSRYVGNSPTYATDPSGWKKYTASEPGNSGSAWDKPITIDFQNFKNEVLIKGILAELFDVRASIFNAYNDLFRLRTDVELFQKPRQAIINKDNLTIDRDKLGNAGSKKIFDRVVFFFGDDGTPIRLFDINWIMQTYGRVIKNINSGTFPFIMVPMNGKEDDSIAGGCPTKVEIVDRKGDDADYAAHFGPAQVVTILHEMLHTGGPIDDPGYWNDQYENKASPLFGKKWVGWPDGKTKAGVTPKDRDTSLNLNDAYVFFIAYHDEYLSRKYTTDYANGKSTLKFSSA